METAIEEALQEALGAPVTVRALRPASGGCINEAAVVETDSGTFFAKWNRHPIADQFDREAEALRALRGAKTELIVPEPLVWRPAERTIPAFLLLEYLRPGSPGHRFDEELGRGLAALHRNSAPQFGFAHDNYCGTSPQPNPWTDDWVSFYREHRLRHQVTLVASARGLSSEDRDTYERLLDRLEELLGIEPEPPALLHGDLWSGNLHVAPDGRPALIDPAAYYGHREAELGMMNLFGGFSPRVWAAYDEAYPLQRGWRDRLALYELYHLLNHYTLFGGGYGAQALAVARRFVA